MTPALLLLALGAGPSPRVERRDVLHSSDGNLTVWNYDSGLGDAELPDWITTVRWVDIDRIHEAIFDEESGRLGWVEAIGVFETPRGVVYLLVSEDQQSPTEFVTILTALRAGNGALVEAAGFFPPRFPGTNQRRSVVAWTYSRRSGLDLWPRPVELVIDEDERRVDVGVSRAGKDAAFALELRGDGLVAVGLIPGVLEPLSGAL